MTNRRSPQTPPTEATTEEPSVANAVGTLALRLFGTKPVLAYTVAGALFFLTAIGWTVGDQQWSFKWPPAAAAAEQSVLPPGKYYIVTIRRRRILRSRSSARRSICPPAVGSSRARTATSGTPATAVCRW
jgi:hypothetical protein